ncbi:MAG: M99 family carboxypeptidase catalytic domain-containing protein, partial [Pseudomonadota bacterium]
MKYLLSIFVLFLSLSLMSEGLTVYKIKGEKPGKTLMIIGGIHGNETSGYLAARQYANVKLKRGNLIVVPDANAPAIKENKRFINVDMNRIFDEENGTTYEYKTVEQIKKLISESDMVVNLHETSTKGSIVMIDDKKLEKIANKVIKTVNRSTKKIRLVLYNYRTASNNTGYKEQRRSLTYYAYYKKKIPAFAVDLSREISDLGDRVEVQTLAVDAFMDELGIE